MSAEMERQARARAEDRARALESERDALRARVAEVERDRNTQVEALTARLEAARVEAARAGGAALAKTMRAEKAEAEAARLAAALRAVVTAHDATQEDTGLEVTGTLVLLGAIELSREALAGGTAALDTLRAKDAERIAGLVAALKELTPRDHFGSDHTGGKFDECSDECERDHCALEDDGCERCFGLAALTDSAPILGAHDARTVEKAVAWCRNIVSMTETDREAAKRSLERLGVASELSTLPRSETPEDTTGFLAALAAHDAAVRKPLEAERDALQATVDHLGRYVCVACIDPDHTTAEHAAAARGEPPASRAKERAARDAAAERRGWEAGREAAAIKCDAHAAWAESEGAEPESEADRAQAEEIVITAHAVARLIRALPAPPWPGEKSGGT